MDARDSLESCWSNSGKRLLRSEVLKMRMEKVEIFEECLEIDLIELGDLVDV